MHTKYKTYIFRSSDAQISLHNLVPITDFSASHIH